MWRISFTFSRDEHTDTHTHTHRRRLCTGCFAECVRETLPAQSSALPVSLLEARLRLAAVLCLLSPTTSARSFQIRFCRASVQLLALVSGLQCCLGYSVIRLTFSFSFSISISLSISVFRFSPFGFSCCLRTRSGFGHQSLREQRRHYPQQFSSPLVVVVVAKIGSISTSWFSLQCCAPYCLRYANYRTDSNRCVHYRLQSLWQDDV